MRLPGALHGIERTRLAAACTPKVREVIKKLESLAGFMSERRAITACFATQTGARPWYPVA